MTAQEFQDWMDEAGIRYAADIVRAVGCARTSAEVMMRQAAAGEDVPVKRSMALAMAAVAAGLRPWGNGKEEA